MSIPDKPGVGSKINYGFKLSAIVSDPDI